MHLLQQRENMPFFFFKKLHVSKKSSNFAADYKSSPVMKNILHSLVLFCMIVAFAACDGVNKPSSDNSSRIENNIISVQRIWAEGYCAFTSLVRYNGRYYCSFREASAHLFDADGKAEGKARLLVSDNGTDWRSLALFAKEGMDLRDPKLSVMPDGRLMMLMGGSVYEERKLKNMFPQVTFSSDGEHFTDLQPVVIDSALCRDMEWIWRVTWFGGTGYGVSYGSAFALVKTTDGVHYELVTPLDVTERPNETSVQFLSDSTMLLMVRREGGDKRGWWGTARPPYTQWQWQEMDIPLGGPDFMILGDTLCIAGSRSLYATEKTMMFKGGLDGHLEEVCMLPSGGDDNSYTGMLVNGDELWVSYYSRHESPMAAIYLARMPLKWFTSPLTSKYHYKYW